MCVNRGDACECVSRYFVYIQVFTAHMYVSRIHICGRHAYVYVICL